MEEIDYMKGWQDRKDVVIPPVAYKGFTEDVIIRKPIEPLPGSGRKAEESQATDYAAACRDKGGLPAGTEKEETYTGEDATTMLEKPLKWRAYIRRVSTGEEAEIVKNPFVMGKSAQCDYVVRDNTTVSRRHARIVTTGEGYMLEDLGSSNHTFIENIQINGPEKLKDRTQFQLSDEDFQFLLEIG